MSIGVIWAQTVSGVIGQNGSMPWNVPEDMAHFKAMTTGHPVVMGRRTWDSFPAKYRPLPGRTNFVISRTGVIGAETTAFAGATLVHDEAQERALEQALRLAAEAPGGDQIWVIGGGQVYKQALELADRAVITYLNIDAEGDTRAPSLPEGQWTMVRREPSEGWLTSTSGVEYCIAESRRIQPAPRIDDPVHHPTLA